VEGSDREPPLSLQSVAFSYSFGESCSIQYQIMCILGVVTSSQQRVRQLQIYGDGSQMPLYDQVSAVFPSFVSVNLQHCMQHSSFTPSTLIDRHEAVKLYILIMLMLSQMSIC